MGQTRAQREAARRAKTAPEAPEASPPEVQGDAGAKAVTDAPAPAVETAEPTTAPETKRRKPYFSV